MANSVDPDETPRSAASHLGLYCLLRPVCPNTYGKYGNINLVGVVGCGKGVMYLTSPGYPTDNGFQLGKAFYPCSR